MVSWECVCKKFLSWSCFLCVVQHIGCLGCHLILLSKHHDKFTNDQSCQRESQGFIGFMDAFLLAQMFNR